MKVMNFIGCLLLLLIPCSFRGAVLTPPISQTEETAEAHSVSYRIDLVNGTGKAFMRIKIVPCEMDHYVKVFVSNENGEPGMRNSQYKCLERPCYLWIPQAFYSKSTHLSMATQCNANCHYNYTIDYFETMRIEDNSFFQADIPDTGSLEVVYPFVQQKARFMLFVTASGHRDIEVHLSDGMKGIAMERVLFNGFGVVLEDDSPVEGKKYQLTLKVLQPTVITVGHRHIGEDQTVYLSKADYFMLNYKLNAASKCFSVSIPVSETKQNSFVLNARSSTRNAHIYVQNSQTQAVITSKDIINTDIITFSYEVLFNNKLCFKRIDGNKSDYVSLHYQLLDLGFLSANQPWLTPLDRGVLTKGFLPKSTILYYRLERFTKPADAQSRTLLKMQMQVIKGNPVLYHYYCDEYPYCQVKPEELDIIQHQLSIGSKVHEDFYHSVDVTTLNPYQSIIQHSALVYCPSGSDCLFNVLLHNEDNTVLFDSQPISMYISPFQTNVYSIEVNNQDVVGLKIELYSFIGKADFIVSKLAQPEDSGQYLFNGSKEEYLLSSSTEGSLIGTYAIKVKGTTNGFYRIVYSTKTKISSYENDHFESGQMMLSTVNRLEKTKTISFRNRLITSGYFISIATINCSARLTFKGKEYTERVNHIAISASEEAQYDIAIDSIALDTHSTSETESCLVYAVGKEASDEHKLLLNEGFKHSMQLTESISAVTYVYPFYRTTNEADSERLMIIISKKSAGKISVSYSIDNKPATSIELVMIQDKKIVIKQLAVLKQCKANSLCSLNVQMKSSTAAPIEYDIVVMNNHQIPTYLDKGIVKSGTSFKDKGYLYYYSDIAYYEQGQIKLNVIKGQGRVLAKIVKKDAQEETPDWNKRVKLPVKEDKNLLKYSSYDNLITYSAEDTKECQAAGCEVYIGVYSDYQALNDSSDYLISIKPSQSVMNLGVNTYARGLLSKEQGEYYTVYIPIEVGKVTIEFSNQFGLCFVKLGGEKPSKDSHDWSMQGRSTFMDISSTDIKIAKDSLIGLSFTFGLFSSVTSVYDQGYQFRVTMNQKKDLNIIQGKGGESLRCLMTEDRCYFSIPVNGYDNVIDLVLYAYNEDALTPALAIYSAFLDGDNYEKMSLEQLKQKIPNEGQSDHSSKTQFNTNYLLIHFTPQAEEAINGYLLVTVVSKHKGRLVLVSSLNKAPSIANPKAEVYQLFYLEKDSEMKLEVFGTGSNLYAAHIRSVDGLANVFNNIKERPYLMGERQFDITIIMKPTAEAPARISFSANVKQHYIFLIQYSLRPEVNIDWVPYGNTIFIENPKKTPFPLAYYLPIDDEESDVSLNFSYEDYEFGYELSQGNQQFNIKAYITNEDVITQLRNSQTLSGPIGNELSTTYDASIRLGLLTASSKQIKAYSSSYKKYLYLTVAPSKENTHKYDYFNSKLYAYQTKAASIPIELQSNRFFFSKLIEGAPQFIKMLKRKEMDTFMEVDVALSSPKLAFSINQLVDNPSSIDYPRNATELIASSKEMSGFTRVNIDLSKAKAGVLISFFKVLSSSGNEDEGLFALEYLTYSTPISHLTFPKQPVYNVTKKGFTVSFDTVGNSRLERSLADYALKLYRKTTDNGVLNSTNSFYSHLIPDQLYNLNKVLTPNITFTGTFTTEDEFYFSIVAKATIKRNQEFIDEYLAFPIYSLQKEQDTPKQPSQLWIYIYITAGVGGSIVIAGIVALIWYIKAKKKKSKKDSIDEYEKIADAVNNIGL